jgi:multiple sugar transport system permease protein
MNALKAQPTAAEIARLLIAIVFLVPFVWLIVTSLKYPRDIITGHWGFTPTLSNFEGVFGDEFQLRPNFANSVIVALLTTAVTVIIAGLAAYSLSQGRWAQRFKGAIMVWLLGVAILPPIALVPAYYLIFTTTRFYNTKLGLILVYTLLNLPLSVWILKGHFDSVPKEFREAAVVDGSGPFGTLWHIFRPLAGPSIASVALLAFLFSWNEFLLALSLTSSPAAQTVPVGVAGFVQEYRVAFGPMAAAAVWACVPAIVLAMMAQKRLVAGLTLGGVKE